MPYRRPCQYLRQPKHKPKVFKDQALIFFKYLQVKKQVYEWNMQKLYRNNIFDYAGHDPCLTHMVWNNMKSKKPENQQPHVAEVSILFVRGPCLNIFIQRISKNYIKYEEILWKKLLRVPLN